jgi:glutamyl-Q tRNA(Asp) synthetase
MPPEFCSRFAPSPTGPLHLGHAYSALLAHDMARAAGGSFVLRMEDTDLERSRSEYEASIQDDLNWLGLRWDGPVLRQSDHLPHYAKRLQPLIRQGLLYPCSCTRTDIRQALAAPQEGILHNVYPGICRGRPMASRVAGDALRLNLDAAFGELAGQDLAFTETGSAQAGRHTIEKSQAMADIGDIVLYRKGEEIVAYFLASALDDASQGITHVIRGEDLFAFTPVQVILQKLLGLPSPIYHHHRLIRDDSGKRLAKRDDARAIGKYRAEGATPADIRRLVGL